MIPKRLFSSKPLFSVFYAVLFFGYIWLMPTTGFETDMGCWRLWSTYSFKNGLHNAYKGHTDYMPVYLYILHLFGILQGTTENIANHIHYLKVVTLVFDFIAGFLLLKIIKQSVESRLNRFLYSLLFFLNLPYLYNTLVWGQMDGILACLVFISIYFAYKGNVLALIVFGVLAVNTKLQAIIFIPLAFLLVWPALQEKASTRQVMSWLVIACLLQFVILAPFIIAGDFERFFFVARTSSGKFPVLSMNAYNIWDWLVDGDLSKTKDFEPFIGIKYKIWGLSMFCLASFFALWPLFANRLRFLVGIKEKFPLEKAMTIGGLIPLAFFFFNTEMHERYSHPALLFIVTAAIFNKAYGAMVFACLAYFLNMEGVLQYFNIRIGSFWFNRDFVAMLYFISILLLYAQLYGLKWKIKDSIKGLRQQNSQFLASKVP